MKLLKYISVLLLITTSAYAQDLTGVLPDPSLTPGVLATSSWNDICNKHLSRDRDVTESEKKDVYTRYNDTPNTDPCNRLAVSGSNKGKPAGCEVDHRGPLEMGFSNDIKNLWPEPYRGIWNAHMKDRLENKMHKLVCSNKVTVQEGQKAFTDPDWTVYYKKYVDPNAK